MTLLFRETKEVVCPEGRAGTAPAVSPASSPGWPMGSLGRHPVLGCILAGVGSGLDFGDSTPPATPKHIFHTHRAAELSSHLYK